MKDKKNNKQEEILSEETLEVQPEQEADEERQAAEGQKEIAELNERLLRKQAEFDNFRRRTREEAVQLSTYVTAEVVKKFLPVLDSFGRALETDKTDDVENFKKGMEMIYRQLEKSVTDAGAEKIPALGEQFSPDLHEAVMNSQNPELPDGQIDMVFEEGYKINDKVIRHSKVRVVNNS